MRIAEPAKNFMLSPSSAPSKMTMMEPFDEKVYALIDDFLREKLTEEKAEQVRQRIRQDAAFAREVEWMKEFHLLMKNEQGARVLNTFREIHRVRQRRAQLIRWAAAAALLVLLVLAGLLWKKTASRSTLPGGEPEKPAVDTPIVPSRPLPPDAGSNDTEPPPASLPATPSPTPPPASPDGPVATTPSPAIPWEQLAPFITYKEGIQTLGEEDDEALDRALRLMDAGKRVEALPFLEQYFSRLTPENEDWMLRLEAGKIYLEGVKNYAKAADQFRRVVQSDAISRFKTEARFYLAMTELARGNTALAERQLRELIQQDAGLWQSRATEVLALIEKSR